MRPWRHAASTADHQGLGRLARQDADPGRAQELERPRRRPDAWQPYNAATGRPFEGAARLRLATAGHDDPRWMTPAQIQSIGGAIRGECQVDE